MTQVFASLLVAGCLATLAVFGFPGKASDQECHGVRKGSIVGFTTCSTMSEQVRVEPVG